MASVNRLRLTARAPSNIALVKYMGKKGDGNIPENGSLSMTLEDLCSFAEVELQEASQDSAQISTKWIAELPEIPSSRLNPAVPQLSREGEEKVLRHVARVRREAPAILRRFGLSERTARFEFILKTANTFPQASGIASSASSFAAITLATAAALAEDFSAFEGIWASEPEFRRNWAALSRQGSGSSCRSFEGPFVEWFDEKTAGVVSRLPELAHFVLVVSASEKSVSSSSAHLRVKTSPLWSGRIERANDRAKAVRTAIESGDFSRVAREAWNEAWEMHSLFHTASEPFSYWEPGTIEALQFFAPAVSGNHPPIVTLDAGPNPHIIVPLAEAASWRARLRERFPRLAILEDRAGRGARVWKAGLNV